ncbi:MAG: hypothetical protein CL973_01265 [Euryarchaeota archaeon]|nr:hypothetical protein [Euryarchaeota archaeon]
MSVDIIVGIFLIIIAILMSYYLIISKLVRRDKISNNDEQYSGSAKQPEKLSEPSDDAIKELEKLIRDIS